MAFELSDLSRWVRGDRSLTAQCSRALAGLQGRVASSSPLGLPARELARGALTGNLIEAGRERPWPIAFTRQMDPEDPGFLPRTPLHRNVNYRDWTCVGLPDHDACGRVDPGGWLTPVPDGPSVAVWVGDARRMYTLGPLPGWGADRDVALSQKRLDGGPFVRTLGERAGVHVRVDAFPAVVDGVLVLGLSARVELRAQAPRPVRVAFAIRAANPQGAAPIFELERRSNGWWAVDGRPFLLVPRPGHDVRVSTWSAGGTYGMLGGRQRSGTHRVDGDERRKVTCPVGQATGAEVYRVNLSPGDTFKRTVWCAADERVAAVLQRASATQMFTGSRADWQGVVRSGARVELPAYGRLLDRARCSLLARIGSSSMAECGAGAEQTRALRALTRLGHGRRVAGILRGAPRPTGAFVRALADHVAISGDRVLGRELWPVVVKAAKGLGDSLADVAALRDAARLGQALDTREARGLLQRAGRAVEALRGADIDDPAAVWPFGLLAPGEVTPPDVHVVQGEGVFEPSLGGIGVRATCARAQLRLAGGRQAVRTLDFLGEQVGPTGAWPEAFHPARGGVAGSGDSLGAAADVVLLLRNAIVLEAGGALHLFRGTDRRWWDGETVLEGLPTRFGPIDLTARRGHLAVRGRWRQRPTVVWHKPEGLEGRLVVGDADVTGRSSTLRLG